MRITGGKARGIPIKAPGGKITRPATDRMREAIFSSLGSDVIDSTVIDLFAGTGAYGLEAISRGASSAIFYEIDRKALNCLKQNQQAVLKACGLGADVTRILARDVYAANAINESASLIFIDPPYADMPGRLDEIFEKADQYATADAYIILELPGDLCPSPNTWQMVRRFGKPNRDTPNAAVFERTQNQTPDL